MIDGLLISILIFLGWLLIFGVALILDGGRRLMKG